MNTTKYINSIDIKGLWGDTDLRWELLPDVNILSGGNGSGKSTILRGIADMFRWGTIAPERKGLIGHIDIVFSDGEQISSDRPFDPNGYKVTVISTFDSVLIDHDDLRKISNGSVHTDLDMEIYRLNHDYLKYQLEIGRDVISALSDGKSAAEVAVLTDHKTLFYDLVDSLFVSTGKNIDRKSDTLNFILGHKAITPFQLSSGEKQVLIILTNALIQNRRPCIMIMDEPEISLHFDWQKRLIEDVMALNPSLQLIIATHSPAVVMRGWIDRVSDISELIVNSDK